MLYLLLQTASFLWMKDIGVQISGRGLLHIMSVPGLDAFQNCVCFFIMVKSTKNLPF